jgi:hypothetical protein
MMVHKPAKGAPGFLVALRTDLGRPPRTCPDRSASELVRFK